MDIKIFYGEETLEMVEVEIVLTIFIDFFHWEKITTKILILLFKSI